VNISSEVETMWPEERPKGVGLNGCETGGEEKKNTGEKKKKKASAIRNGTGEKQNAQQKTK